MKYCPILVLLLALVTNAFGDDLSSLATLRLGESCGFAKAGHVVYVVNKRNNVAIKVTVSSTTHAGIRTYNSQRVVPVPASGEVSLGCDTSGSVDANRTIFRIVGVETK